MTIVILLLIVYRFPNSYLLKLAPLLFIIAELVVYKILANATFGDSLKNLFIYVKTFPLKYFGLH